MIDSNFDNQSSGRGFRINEEIAGPSVRVVDSNNVNHGVFTVAEAIRMARGLGLDLVDIAPNAHPAICKMIKSSEFRRELELKK
jgi:translation initiation factor IF-3